jgi:hypothetical protein
MEFRIKLYSEHHIKVHEEILDIKEGSYYRIGAYCKPGEHRCSYDIRLEYIEDFLKPYLGMLVEYDYLVICGSGENAATDRKYKDHTISN